MKRITALVVIASMLVIFSGCGDDEKTSSTRRARHESTLTEETLVEDIIVEEIHVEEIQVNEISWEDNTTYWEDVT